MIALACAPGIPAALAQEWSDPVGDVTMPNSDVYCGAAIVDAETLHLFVRLADVPFGGSNIHVGWGIDTDQDALTGDVIGLAPGADTAVRLDATQEPGVLSLQIVWLNPFRYLDLDPIAHTNYDGTNRLLHVSFPLELIDDDGAFNYIFSSSFGGSFGANEWAPQPFSFAVPGGFFTSAFGDPVACVSEDIPPPPPVPGVETIQYLIEKVESLLAAGAISQANAHALISELEEAIRQIRIEHPITAARVLGAFVNEVEALVRPGVLAEAEGTILIDYGQEAADFILGSTSETGCIKPTTDPAPRTPGGRLRHGANRSPLRPSR